MGVLFAEGNAYELRRRLREDLAEELRSEQGGEVILIVPGQLTLDAEQLALAQTARGGSFRLSVYSPARLCERILERTGAQGMERIDEDGLVMLMRRAIREMHGRLRAFERSKRQMSFAPLAMKACTEWKEAGAKPEDLRALSEKHAGTMLSDKLQDIACLMEALEKTREGLGLDGEDLRRRAAAALSEENLFAGAHVWFYGFDMLTRPVAQLIAALGRQAERVCVLLAPPEEKCLEKIFRRMTAMLDAASVSYTQERIRPYERPRCAARVLEERLFKKDTPAAEGEEKGLHLYAALNANDEAEYCAAVIRETARLKNWRYRDFAVACADADEMYPVLEDAFALYGIPLFLPQGRPAANQPLCATLLAVLRMASGQTYETDAQTYIGLGYSPLTDEEADTLRNFAFRKGVSKWRWRTAYRPVNDEDEKGIRFEELRSRCFAPVEALGKGLRLGSTRDRLCAVFNFLTELNVCEKMQQIDEKMRELGELLSAAEGAEAWKRLIHCLDQIDAMYANAPEPIEPDELAGLMRQSLSTAELKPLPQSADAVLVGSLDHMKAQSVKMLLIIGATDATPGEQPALISEADREAIDGGDRFWLGPDRGERLQMQHVAARNALSMAENFVRVSWHVSDLEGGVARPGDIVGHLNRIFPGIKMNGGVTDSDARDLYRYVQPDAALARAGLLLSEKNDWSEKELETLEALCAIPEYREQIRDMRGALAGDSIPEKLDRDVANRLYSGPASLNITRLEQFAACPFAHFIRYGLKPEELEPYGLAENDSGTFCHKALNRFAQQYPEETDLETAAKRMDALTSEMLKEDMPWLQEDDFLSRHEIEELRLSARQAAVTMLAQMGVSRFRPAQSELAFSDQNALKIDGVKLEGRIDRLDTWRDPETGRMYITVCDYKRNVRRLDAAKIYYGLQLQLLVYLLAAGQMYDADYAACLYFNVSDPVLDTRETDETAVREARLKELRLTGLVLDDQRVVEALSDPPEAALPLKNKADGTLAKSNNLISAEQMGLLIERAVKCAKEDLAGIRAGEIGAHPFAKGQETPCKYCRYAAICRRDALLSAARDRKIPSMKSEELWKKLEEDKQS